MSAKKKAIRDNFREAVFKRDKYKCVFCQCTTNLDAHHITDRNELPAGGYVLENGITLCPEHHQQAEVWHSTAGKDFVDGMKPDDLYKAIHGSRENAFLASKKLEAKLNRAI